MRTAEAIDPEVAAIAAQAKKRRRLILAIVAGNALVFALLVGGPYFRGRHRALEGRQAFGELAACLWGGEPADDPGLSLPPGEEQAYIDAFRAAPESWPMHCADELDRVPPERVFWLFPDTRHAEGEVRRAAAMVREELAAAAGADREGTVPSRPRLAVQRLQAALTLWSEEADVYIGLEDPLIALPERRAVQPERVPLRAAEDARVWMEPRGDGLEVRAIDERGISWVRVGGGRVDMRRLRKPALVDAFGASERWPLLVWRTPEERCAPDCGRQAIGVAFLTDDTDVTPDPRWIAAHPAGPSGSHVRADGEGNVWVVAAGGESLEWRAFRDALGDRPDAEEPEDEAGGPRPAAPDDRRPLRGYGQPVLLSGGAVHQADGAPVLSGDWLAVVGEAQTRVHRVVGGGGGAHGAAAAQESAPREAADAGADAGSDPDASAGEPPAAAASALELVGTLPEAPEGLSLAGDAVAAVLAPRPGGAAVHRCAAGACTELGVLADAVDPQLAVLGQVVVVAYAREGDAQIRVARWDAAGAFTDRPAPAACTTDEGGFCGPPVIGARGGRLALGARDGSDLWVLESRDGARWQPLSGLR